MAVRCSRCGYVRAEDSDAWDCPQCGTTNRTSESEPASGRSHPTSAPRSPRETGHGRPAPPASTQRRIEREPPRPSTVTVTDNASEIIVVYRWFSWSHLLLALGGFVVAFVVLKTFPIVFGGPIGLVLAAAAAYVGLVTLLNRSTVRATRERLQAKHGPVPILLGDAMDAFGFWPDVQDASVPTVSLIAIATGERRVIDTSADGYESPTKVYLRAVYHDGAGQTEIQLLPSTAPPAVETFVGWHLGRWLQDAELPHYKGVDLTPD